MTNKEIRNLTCIMTVICVLGIIFALAYPMVAYGQEAAITAPDSALVAEFKDLQVKLQLEQINVENLIFRFNTNTNEIDRLRKLNDNLNIALGILRKNIEVLQARIQQLRDEVKNETKP